MSGSGLLHISKAPRELSSSFYHNFIEIEQIDILYIESNSVVVL